MFKFRCGSFMMYQAGLKDLHIKREREKIS